MYACFSCSLLCLLYFILLFDFFFFKQKTAYEMRISDWSSDVCSSDLRRPLNSNGLGLTSNDTSHSLSNQLFRTTCTSCRQCIPRYSRNWQRPDWTCCSDRSSTHPRPGTRLNFAAVVSRTALPIPR